MWREEQTLVQQNVKTTLWYFPGISSVANRGQKNWTMSDFIKTLGESNQDALAFKFPDDRGYICSNLLCEVSTEATGIGIMFLRNTKMCFVVTLLNSQCTTISNEQI